MSGDRNTERSQPIEGASQQTNLSEEVRALQMQRREEVTRNINNSSSVGESNGGASPARQNSFPGATIGEGGSIQFQVGTNFAGTTWQGIRLGYSSGGISGSFSNRQITELDPANDTITRSDTNAVVIRVGH